MQFEEFLRCHTFVDREKTLLKAVLRRDCVVLAHVRSHRSCWSDASPRPTPIPILRVADVAGNLIVETEKSAATGHRILLRGFRP